MQDPAEEYAATGEAIARRARELGVSIASAESLTAGAISVALGAAPEASDWFRGGVVAYAEAVKRELLGVTAENVTSAECARQLASGVTRVLGADASVAVTGVGGPGPTDGEPAGTVFVAATAGGRVLQAEHRFDGSPAEVVHRTVGAALDLLLDALDSAAEAGRSS
ncbi:CinA family protein [Agromyces sp. G08B096]|uniref:CinA family protein n=1 Tax=Agromyces sp. G08B096 TaxID=3156399 RepID=A0AAU7W849_9MICO